MNVFSDPEVTLLSPLKIGGLQFKNRVVMAPLTRNRAGKGNIPTATNVEYYRQRASAGLIISEGAQIAAEAVGYPGTPGIHSPEQIEGWKKVTAGVHDQGGKIFVQLWHCGRISHSSLLPGGRLPSAPSAIKPAGSVLTPDGMQPYELPHALTREEIPGIIEMYRAAARNAMNAGFDGIEIHAANGYLLDQFLRDGTNRRNDQYGGSLENRARLLLEVIRAVSEIWDPKHVGVRLSPLQPFNDMRDSNPKATFSHAAGELNRFGLAYLHITEMGAENPGAAGPAFDIGVLRDLREGVYMTNGNYDLDSGNSLLADRKADMVSFGKLFIANPDLPIRFAKRAPLNASDQNTFYGGGERGYIDYPFLEEA